MARIRTIKPEFPHSESMGAVSRDARLCFILLWTLADDSGRLRGDSRLLASLLFPYDEDSRTLISGWLQELESQGCIVCYKVGEHSYVQIMNWANHQKIDKPSGSKLPSFDESSRILANPTRIVGERSSGERIKEGKGMDQGREMIVELPIGIPPTKEEVQGKMKDLGFADPAFETTKFFDYWEGLGWHRGKEPMKNWRSSCNTWKTNSVSRGEFPGVVPKADLTEPILGIDYMIDLKTGARIPVAEYVDED